MLSYSLSLYHCKPLKMTTYTVCCGKLLSSPLCTIYSLQDLELSDTPDDHLLLEEMALYQEGEGQEAELEELVGAGLSDSKNHDELMLQMEEFM